MAVEELGLEVSVEGFRLFMRRMREMDRATGKVSKGWSALSGVAGIATGALSGLATIGIGAVVAGATAAVAAIGAMAAGMIKLGIDGVKAAADFQDQITILGFAASSSAMSFDELHDVALQVGGDIRLVGVSATGAADAMTNLYKAGLSDVEIFGDLQGYMAGTAELGGALRASIDLAAASELDMATAAEVAAVALSTFGAELVTEEERAEFITRAMNNMVQAADASVASVSDLAESLKMVGPAAGAMGISIEDVNNALALLSTRGIRGTMAGTSLNRMLLDLGKTTPKATKMMAQLGIEVYDLEGNMLPLVDIVGQFEDALGGATDAERDAALQAIFTAQGMRAMNTLLLEGVEGWDAMAEATGDASSMYDIAAARAETYSGKVEALEGVMETLKITIGEALLPVLTSLVEWFSEMVSTHGPMLTGVFEAIGSAIESALPFITGFVEQALSLVTNVGPALEEMGITWDTVWAGIQSAIEGAAERIQPLVETIVAWFEENGPQIMEEFQALWERVWGDITDIADNFISWWDENLPLIQETAETLLDFWLNRVVPVLDNVWGIIVALVGGGIDRVLKLVTLIMQVITGDWEGAWETIKEIAASIWDTIVKVIEEFIEGVANAVGTTTEGIKETWSNNWEMLKEIVRAIWERIVTAITEKVQAIRDAISAKITEIQEWWSETWTAISEAATEIWEGIITAITEKIDAIRTAIEEKVTEIQEMWQTIWDTIVEIATTIWENIKEAILEQLRALFEEMGLDFDEYVIWWGETWADIQLILTEIWERIVEFLMEKVTIIRDFFTEHFEALRTWWGETWDAISTKLSEIWTAIVTLVTEKVLAAYTAINTKIEELKAWWSTTWDAISTKLSEIWTAIVTAVTEKVLEVYTAVNTKITELQTWWDETWDAISTKLSEIWTAIVEAVIEKAQEVYDEISAKIDEIREWIGEQVDKFVTVGENLIDGIKQGVLNKVGELIAAARGAVEQALAAAKAALGIESPSQAFRIQVGRPIMEGIATGLADLTPMVQAQIAAAISPALGGYGAGGTITSNVENTYNYNLTTESITRPGGLAMEFATMGMASR